MPKSKRDKQISLTKVKKKGREAKEKLLADVRRCVERYENLFLFSVDDMRNSKLKDVRQDFKTDSRLFYGKNKVMAMALGRIKEEELQTNIHKLSRQLKGHCGLLFTDRPLEEVQRYFGELAIEDFARSGAVASKTVHLPAGPMEEFSFSLETQFRKLGLPTALQKGVIVMLKDHTVCNKGDKLTPDQVKLLKLLGIMLATFQVKLVCYWSKTTGKCMKLLK